MTQTQGMAHLVHDHVFDVGLRNGFCIGAIHVHTARFEEVHGEMHFLRAFVSIGASGMVFMRSQGVAHRVGVERS